MMTTTRRAARSDTSRSAATTSAMLQLLSPDELSLPFSDHVELEDAESGVRRLVDATGIRATYESALAEFLERSRSSAARDGIDYALLATDTPPATALREYLIKRAARPTLRGSPRAVAT